MIMNKRSIIPRLVLILVATISVTCSCTDAYFLDDNDDYEPDIADIYSLYDHDYKLAISDARLVTDLLDEYRFKYGFVQGSTYISSWVIDEYRKSGGLLPTKFFTSLLEEYRISELFHGIVHHSGSGLEGSDAMFTMVIEKYHLVELHERCHKGYLSSAADRFNKSHTLDGCFKEFHSKLSNLIQEDYDYLIKTLEHYEHVLNQD